MARRAVFFEPTPCRRCGALVLEGRIVGGSRMMSLDAEPSIDGNVRWFSDGACLPLNQEQATATRRHGIPLHRLHEHQR